VLPLGLPDNEVTKHLTGEMRLKETIWLMVRVLRAKLAQSRTILVFEDVHWMDSSSWKLLEAVRRELSPLLLLITMRPGAEAKLPPDGRTLLDEGNRSELSGLNRSEVERLLLQTLEVQSIPSEVAQEVMDRSAGNPLFAKEFALAMRDEGLISCVDGVCELLVRLDQIDFPPSVEALITSRFDRLPPASLLLLKVAAVCGSEFSVDMLLAMLATAKKSESGTQPLSLGIDSAQVGPTLENLVSGEADMLRRAEGSRPGDFVFKHRYLQEVAYELTAEELKERLHSAAAAYFEELRDKEKQLGTDTSIRSGGSFNSRRVRGTPRSPCAHDDLPTTDSQQPHLEALVYHWTRAGRSTRVGKAAVKYLKLLGDQALDNFSLVEAKELHEMAFRYATDDEALKQERGPLQRRMARRHYLQGEAAAAEELLTAALIAFDAERTPLNMQADGSVAWRSRLLRLRHMRQRISPFSHWPVAGGAPANSPEDADLLEVAACYEQLAQLHLVGHRVRLAEYCARRALSLGLRLPSLTPVVARSYAALLQVAASSGASSRTVSYFKSRALRTCHQLGENAQLVFTFLAVAIHEASSAKWALARDYFHRALEIVSDLKDLRLWEDVVSHTGHAQFYAGDFTPSLVNYQAALQSAQDRQDKQMENRCNSGIAAIYLATRRTADAHAILKNTNSYGQLALCLLRLGHADQAMSYALKVKDRFKGPRTKYYVLKAFSSTAEVFLRLLERAKIDAEAADGRKSVQACFGGLLGNGAVISISDNREGASTGSLLARHGRRASSMPSVPTIAEVSHSASIASSTGHVGSRPSTPRITTDPSHSMSASSISMASDIASAVDAQHGSSKRGEGSPKMSGVAVNATLGDNAPFQSMDEARISDVTLHQSALASRKPEHPEKDGDEGFPAEDSMHLPRRGARELHRDNGADQLLFTLPESVLPLEQTPSESDAIDGGAAKVHASTHTASVASPHGPSTSTTTSTASVPLEQLQSLAEEWIDKLKQFGELYAVARPRAWLLRGQLYMLTGKRRQGLRSFHRSLSVASKLGMGYDRALALMELGRHATDLTHATRYLTMALELFNKAGASYDAARCSNIYFAWERAASGNYHAADLLGEPPDLPNLGASDNVDEEAGDDAKGSSQERLSAGSLGHGPSPPMGRVRSSSLPSPSRISPVLPIGRRSCASPLPSTRSPRRSNGNRSPVSLIFRGSAVSSPPTALKERNSTASSPFTTRERLRSSPLPGKSSKTMWSSSSRHDGEEPARGGIGSPRKDLSTSPLRPVRTYNPLDGSLVPLAQSHHKTIDLASLASPAHSETKERPAPLVRQRTPEPTALEMAAFAVAASRENSFRLAEMPKRMDSRGTMGTGSVGSPRDHSAHESLRGSTTRDPTSMSRIDRADLVGQFETSSPSRGELTRDTKKGGDVLHHGDSPRRILRSREPSSLSYGDSSRRDAKSDAESPRRTGRPTETCSLNRNHSAGRDAQRNIESPLLEGEKFSWCTTQ